MRALLACACAAIASIACAHGPESGREGVNEAELVVPQAGGAGDGPDVSAAESAQAIAAPPAQGGVLAEGIASWYGLEFHGRRTASGERFDMNALTAAHPSLPFGTRVLVRNPQNGRSVVVRINDRGPHVDNRIIDLSHAAARALGMLGFGTKRVVLSVPPASAAPR